MYSFEEYILLFFIISILGWCMEVILKLVDDHKFINRGFLIGPYCPIYGSGTLLIILFLNGYKENILLLFIMSTIICSVLEYVASYIMEKMFNARWWDYSHYKFNLNGRICLINSILFGIGGTILILYIVPTLIRIINLINIDNQKIIILVLGIIYIIDNIVSFSVVWKFKNLNNKYKNKDNTEEITKMIKKNLENSFFIKRIRNAYPNMQKRFTEISNGINLKKQEVKAEIKNVINKIR